MIKLKQLLLEALSKIPPQMYHGSTESRANKAWKNGLEAIGTKKNYEWCAKGVFLTTDPELAKHFGNSGNYPPEKEDRRMENPMSQIQATMFGLGAGREDVIILTISTKGLDPKKFKPDPMSPKSLIYFGQIPPKHIVDWTKVD